MDMDQKDNNNIVDDELKEMEKRVKDDTLHGLTCQQLKKYLKFKKLPVYGKKLVLIKRIKANAVESDDDLDD